MTALLWLVTTVLLAATLPAVWAQRHLVDSDGYAHFAQGAAADPKLQDAMAAELATQLSDLASNSGYDTDTDLLRAVTGSYTGSSAFPEQFAQANRFAHRWLFTNTVRSDLDSQGRWVVDLGPMLNDSSIQQTLQSFGVTAPSSLPVPLTENAAAGLRPGQLQQVARWGPWASVGLTILTGIFAVLTLAVARRRGKALVALGASAILVGGAGWAGLEIGRRRLDGLLGNTPDDIRQIAESMVSHAVAGMHDWLNLSLLGGAGLVAVGLVATLLGGLWNRTSTRDAPTSAPAV